MLMTSALTNHWVGGRSGHHGYPRNSSVGCIKVLAWNHNVIKGKQLLSRDRVASTGWQITRAVQKNSSNDIHLRMKNKWWETDMKANMKNIKSKEDLDEQLLMAGDNLAVVHFFSPRCPACKALHPKVHQYAGMHPELQFLFINCDNREIRMSHNVHVFPMFCFYRGAEGHIYSFSCTITTIHKFKDALKRHGVQTENLAAEKGLTESDLKGSASSTDVPNKIDASQNMEESDLQSSASSTDVPNEIDLSQNMDEDVGPITTSNE